MKGCRFAETLSKKTITTAQWQLLHADHYKMVVPYEDKGDGYILRGLQCLKCKTTHIQHAGPSFEGRP